MTPVHCNHGSLFLCSLVNYSLHIFILINCGKYSPGADTEHMAAAPDISDV